MQDHDEMPFFTHQQIEVLEQELLANLKKHAGELAKLLQAVSGREYEDTVYRFYHYSFKVYGKAQHYTQLMVDCLRRMAPTGTRFDPLFEEICRKSLEPAEFKLSHNDSWGEHTRPFIEAFFHARYFVEMAVKYGAELDEPPA